MGYVAATRMDEALEALAGGGAVSVIAGGTDWFPAQGERPFAGTLLDVTRVAGLRGIAPQAGGWRIGAATTWTDLLRADLPPAFDGLKQAAREVGSVQIQNAGTLVGNLCTASPAADGVPPLLTLGAEVELASAGGVRRLPLAEFLQGPRKTARRPDELVGAIHVPSQPDGARGGFVKLGARRYLVISIAMVAALVVVRGGRVADIRIAAGAASPVAKRLPDLEDALRGAPAAEIGRMVAPDLIRGLAPISDIRADAAYRTEAVAELVRRALGVALGEG